MRDTILVNNYYQRVIYRPMTRELYTTSPDVRSYYNNPDVNQIGRTVHSINVMGNAMEDISDIRDYQK